MSTSRWISRLNPTSQQTFLHIVRISIPNFYLETYSSYNLKDTYYQNDMRNLPPKALIAVIAVKALPGAPRYKNNDNEIIDSAMSDLEQYKKAGVDSIKFENDHDVPYGKPPIDEKAIELMTKITKLAREKFDGPIGVQILEAANEDSLRIAGEADLDWIRVEAYVFAHIGNSGLIEGCSAKLQRRKAEWGYKDIKIFTDVKKKHCSHAITADLDVTDEVRQAEYSMVDGFIVTSKFTGIEPNTEDLKKVKNITKLPVFIGSGMTKDNLKTFFPLADGFIVGSTFREKGEFFAELDPERLKQFVDEFNRLKSK